ncbi:MAG: hypothetical protein ACLFNM_01040 [Candidatus Woesearchaeota archaeon]
MITPRQEEILSAISKGIQTPTALGKHTSCSLPYITIQLQLLQAKELISKEAQKKKQQVGRPQQKYSIIQPITSIQTIHNANVSTTVIKEKNEELFNTFIQLSVQVPSRFRNSFAEYFWTRPESFARCQAIGIISSKEDEIELIAITQPQYLEILREKISHVHITHDKKQIHFACWVHSKKECETGIEKQDDYYLTMLKKTKRLVDADLILKKLREKI